MTHNPVRPWRNIERRKSHQIHVGSVPVGGDAPIAVQTMTNTPTTDIAATVAQVQAAAEAGADLVRVSVPDEASSKALKEIVAESPVPIIADIHFHYRRGIEAAEAGAACLRINPGNIGSEERVREVIAAARDHVPPAPDSETVPGVRGGVAEGVRIHALRVPGLLARMECLFGGPGDTLTLRHDTLTRESFMPGVLLGVRRIRDFDGLVYGLEHLL